MEPEAESVHGESDKRGEDDRQDYEEMGDISEGRETVS